MKLGKGEFEHVDEDGSTLSLNDARDYFLIAVNEVAPEVLDALANEPFKHYKAAGLAFDREAYNKEIEQLEFFDQVRAMIRAQSQHSLNRPDWPGHYETQEIAYDEKIAAMQKSIFDWSRKHNLDANWCRERAFETLDYWHKHPDFGEHRIWQEYCSMQTIVPDRNGLNFQLSIRSLYPSLSFRREEKERITAHFERELDLFLDSRERLAEENGMIRPKHRPVKSNFLWCAHNQVKALSHVTIARNVNQTREAVRDGVNRVRVLLACPTDPASVLESPTARGRPKKN